MLLVGNCHNAEQASNPSSNTIRLCSCMRTECMRGQDGDAADTWQHIVQAQHAWEVLDSACAEAEGQFAALATWAAAARRPSAGSVAAVALERLRQETSAQAARLADAGNKCSTSAGLFCVTSKESPLHRSRMHKLLTVPGCSTL